MSPHTSRLPLHAPLQDLQLLDPATARTLHPQLYQQQLQASFERGRIEGERALSQQLLQQRSELMELHTGVLQALQLTLPQLRQESEHALVQLALEVARKLVGDFPLSPELVEAAIRQALAQVDQTTEITVLLHPDDLALLRANQSPLLQPRPDAPPLRLQEDPDCSRGGCLLRTRFGLLDARRETKFERLQHALAS